MATKFSQIDDAAAAMSTDYVVGTRDSAGVFSDLKFTMEQIKDYIADSGAIPKVVAYSRATGQTAANPSVTSYTLGSADGTYEVSANALITSGLTFAIQIQCDYKDEGNTSRSLILQLGAPSLPALTGTMAAVDGPIPYYAAVATLRVRRGSTITLRTVGTFTSVTYNIEGIIKKIS